MLTAIWRAKSRRQSVGLRYGVRQEQSKTCSPVSGYEAKRHNELTQFSSIRELLLQEESATGSVRQRPYQERQAYVVAVGKGHVAVIKLLVERRKPAVAHSCD